MADHYAYRVRWEPESQEYVGTCAEFPSLSHLATDQYAALRGIQELVADVVADLEDNDEPVPKPLADRLFSGKFMTRVPPELHRVLALEAAEAGVSLNRLVSLKLAIPPMIAATRTSKKARATTRLNK